MDLKERSIFITLEMTKHAHFSKTKRVGHEK